MEIKKYMFSDEEMSSIEETSLEMEKEEASEANGAAWFAIPVMVGAFMACNSCS